MIDYYEPKLDLTLLGCGFLGCYHVGAVLLLAQIWPKRPYNRICGASCGGLLGALLTAAVKLDEVLDAAVGVLRQFKTFFSHPIKLICLTQLVEQSLQKHLPQDAHLLCSNKLGLSLTQLRPFENKFVSTFNSRQDLIEAVVAGCHIPFWSGLSLPKFRGRRFIDGAYSDNMPRFRLTPQEEAANVRQVAVTPFMGLVQVSPPSDNTRWRLVFNVFGSGYCFNWSNLIRTTRAMIPHRPQTYRLYLIEGHRDMKNFVLTNNLIKCRTCFARTNFATQPCLNCLKLLEKVDSLEVPRELIEVISS